MDRAWEGVAALIHQGWPTDKQAFSDKQSFLNEPAAMLGMIRGRDSLWLYRVYPAGRDSDRPGRYFFVVLRLSSFEQVVHPRVAGLLAYFEKERGLPLNTSPLEREWPEKEVDMNLSNLHRECEVMPSESHWGVDSKGRVLRFKYVAWEEVSQKHDLGRRGVKMFALGAGLLIATVGISLLSRPGGGERDLPDQPMPMPEDIDPSDRDTVSKANGEPPSPPDHSPQPPTSSPGTEIEP